MLLAISDLGLLPPRRADMLRPEMPPLMEECQLPAQHVPAAAEAPQEKPRSPNPFQKGNSENAGSCLSSIDTSSSFSASSQTQCEKTRA